MYVRSNKRFEVNAIGDDGDCDGKSKKMRVILDVIKVKQTVAKEERATYMFVVLTAVQNLPLSLAR